MLGSSPVGGSSVGAVGSAGGASLVVAGGGGATLVVVGGGGGGAALVGVGTGSSGSSGSGCSGFGGFDGLVNTGGGGAWDFDTTGGGDAPAVTVRVVVTTVRSTTTARFSLIGEANEPARQHAVKKRADFIFASGSFFSSC